jgi:hypothetical protein
MKLFRIAVCGCIAFMTLGTNSNAFNYIFLKGKGRGGEMMCSDWNRPTNKSERVAMTQWILGFITGYDAAIRPNPSDGSLNGQPIANLIVDMCKKNPKADLVSAAKYIATYIQREISGEVSQPIILNRGSARAEPDPDRWLIVKDVSRNSCAVLASRPVNEDAVILTSFKAYMIGGKAMKEMVVAECGCDRGCNFELPR